MHRLTRYTAWFALTLGASAISAPQCGSGQNCPQSAPCCSQYGQCGLGAYCLGGCDPLFSYDLNSCIPAPTCQSENYRLDSLGDIEQNTIYLGDASKGTNWVASGTPVVYKDGNGKASILLTMAQGTVGTLLSSTHYVWFGKISATMRTSAGQGVVTAFIMMSDVKDEIDFEFVGADLQHTQSNYYWQGVPDYNNELNLTAANTNTETHTYTIDWKPERVTWYVDDVAMRTLHKADTYNKTDNTYHFPQTPSRVQLSLWPAGKAGNAPGTINWSGGLIDWQSPYMQNGYYYAQVLDVQVECYNPPAGTNTTGSQSYVYTDTSGLEDSVAITNEQVVLSSFYASGDNPGYNPNGHSSSSGGHSKASGHSSSSSATPVPTNVQTVPGINNPGGAGLRGDGSGNSGGSSSGGSSSGGSSSGGSPNGVPSIGGASMGGHFNQGTGSSGNSNGAQGLGSAASHGSAFAVLVAVIGCMFL